MRKSASVVSCMHGAGLHVAGVRVYNLRAVHINCTAIFLLLTVKHSTGSQFVDNTYL